VISAVDTNVLLDVLVPDAVHGEGSEGRLVAALSVGSLVISEAACAELSAHFDEAEDVDRFIGDTGIHLVPSSLEALHRAGAAWRAYARRRPPSLVCPQCGTAQAVRCAQCDASVQVRQHVVADFMIGAHALVHADRLITRDRGYYSRYFPDLELV